MRHVTIAILKFIANLIAGAVIRMFQYVTGDEMFRASLNRYLNDK